MNYRCRKRIPNGGSGYAVVFAAETVGSTFGSCIVGASSGKTREEELEVFERKTLLTFSNR